MEYVVVAFRSRAQTVGFHQFLSRYNVSSEIVNTPKEAGVGCGLSVKVSKSVFSAVKTAVSYSNYNSFAGFFLVKHVGGKRLVRSI